METSHNQGKHTILYYIRLCENINHNNNVIRLAIYNKYLGQNIMYILIKIF